MLELILLIVVEETLILMLPVAINRHALLIMIY